MDMKRRTFIASLAALPTALLAQKGPPEAEPVEQFTTPAMPTIALNHLGFRQGVSKTLIVRITPATPKVESCLLEDVVPPFRTQIPLRRSGSDFGPVLLGDLSALNRPGIYQVTLGQERNDQPQVVNGVEQWEHSVPFFVRDDVWRRTLPQAVGYYRYQRCGVAVPGVHPACHLDDARRRDNGEHVDLVGGWHDAGDVRKWMDVTLLNGIALLNLRRELVPREGDPTSDQLLEEVRFGNRYFLKMQDRDGLVWHDTAGGVNGNNSDNHWTDNIIGTADDRYLDTRKLEVVSAIFVALEALAAQSYQVLDAPYATQCLAAGQRAWQAWQERSSRTLELAWWIMAGCELWRATRDDAIREQTMHGVRQLLANQVRSYSGGRRAIRGFWLEENPSSDKPSPDPFVNLVFSAMPPIVLLEFSRTFPEHTQSSRCLDAVRMYVEDYVLPMTERNAYRIMPIGLYLATPTPETYRPLDGDFTYRYFLPVRKQFWWQGGNCHLAQHALLLARLAECDRTGDGARSQSYVTLAYRQLEWIMGANPFSSCMMTGEGVRNPYPHSRFVGPIPGGIMNGIAGNASDEPILDLEYGIDWRTCEYWSPHVAFYILANAVLERAHSSDATSER
jgi:hypothetical protein